MSVVVKRLDGLIKMPLGTKTGLSPGHIVLDGDPAPPKRGTAPDFRPMSIVAKQSPISATAEHLLFFVTPNLLTYRGQTTETIFTLFDSLDVSPRLLHS